MLCCKRKRKREREKKKKREREKGKRGRKESGGVRVASILKRKKKKIDPKF